MFNFIQKYLNRNKTIIYTDMSYCDGVVGIAAVAFKNGEFVGHEASSYTVFKNNTTRFEASAIMLGLSTFHKGNSIIYTDSKNVVQGLTDRGNFKYKSVFVQYIKKGQLKIEWVRGHSKSRENKLVDHLAGCARKLQLKEGDSLC